MENVIGLVLFLAVVGGVGYWMYSKKKGPFEED